ncbi:MAG: hypothetical protein CMM93_07050 [Rickettsiales bacterium]|nr:hypothetical protein [Rickettsiales bacterium]|tara:strand:+ start:331 stop:810 length:480 start_codon:yes stop_codon:yes gene_type:complete
MDIVSEIKLLSEELKTRETKLTNLKSMVGSYVLLHIYSMVIRNLNVSPKNPPLYEFQSDKTTYQLYIDFMKDYGPGECFQLEQFEGKECHSDLKHKIEFLEKFYLDNVIGFFDKLPNTQKYMHPELSRVKIGRKRNYTYYYKGAEFKKLYMGFVIVPKN